MFYTSFLVQNLETVRHNLDSVRLN